MDIVGFHLLWARRSIFDIAYGTENWAVDDDVRGDDD